MIHNMHISLASHVTANWWGPLTESSFLGCVNAYTKCANKEPFSGCTYLTNYAEWTGKMSIMTHWKWNSRKERLQANLVIYRKQNKTGKTTNTCENGRYGLWLCLEKNANILFLCHITHYKKKKKKITSNVTINVSISNNAITWPKYIACIDLRDYVV